ncbi:hypothetical protein C7S15_8913 (plasmid) [Burkholderia cepacia]|nr:hypothetical protein [Burkholderia cepacia]
MARQIWGGRGLNARDRDLDAHWAAPWRLAFAASPASPFRSSKYHPNGVQCHLDQ